MANKSGVEFTNEEYKAILDLCLENTKDIKDGLYLLPAAYYAAIDSYFVWNGDKLDFMAIVLDETELIDCNELHFVVMGRKYPYKPSWWKGAINLAKKYERDFYLVTPIGMETKTTEKWFSKYGKVSVTEYPDDGDKLIRVKWGKNE